jgi:hypothetical protein
MGAVSSCHVGGFETWSYPKLEGSLGTVADLFNPSGTFGKYAYGKDFSPIGANYAIRDTVPVAVLLAEADRAVSNWAVSSLSVTDFLQSNLDPDNICIESQGALLVGSPTGTILPYRMWNIRRSSVSSSLSLGMNVLGNLELYAFGNGTTYDTGIFINDGIFREYRTQTDASGTVKIYVNGALVFTRTNDWFKQIDNTIPIVIGSQKGDAERQWPGYLSYVKVCEGVNFDFVNGSGAVQETTDGNFSITMTANLTSFWDSGITYLEDYNPRNDPDMVAAGVSSAWLTSAQRDVLNFPDVRHTCPVAATSLAPDPVNNRRQLVYLAGTDFEDLNLTDDAQAYVWRSL